MKGIAAILSFPFRIYAADVLPELAGSHRQTRVRIHPPFRVREKGSPLSPDVPIERWPQFKWSPKTPGHLRMKPPKELAPAPFPGPAYDAMRVDVWGSAAERLSSELPKLFLRWLRYLSRQPWIGEFEGQTDPLVKNTFEIDRLGRVTVTPWAYGVVVTPSPYMQPVDASMWRHAFDQALAGTPAPTHWQLFLDSHNERASGKIPETILALALSLEISRDTLFPTLTFQDTDLLKHLSLQLHDRVSRDLSAEHPSVYESISALYVARHHVAHGKPPTIRLPDGRRPVEMDDLLQWTDATFQALIWLEDVALSNRV